LAAQRERHILNVCSVVGLMPVRKLAIYQTNKFGLGGFSLALRTLGYRFNIGVTALCPSLVGKRSGLIAPDHYGPAAAAGRKVLSRP
jgi:3-oxoacyl-[acyl-carrier protein] reductase